MKKVNFRKILPHVIAIAIFLVFALLFCKPALEPDVVLQQGDIAGWQGMSHQAFQYKEANGHFPFWASNMFSGMPAYQIAMEGPWTPLTFFHTIFTFGLPTPFSFFFLACIAFYFLCQCLRLKPWASVLGALAFSYCTFDPIIVTAGHNTQMFALAYAPALLGAIILLFEKNYFSGFILTTLISALQILQNHQQISYYLFMVIAAMSIAYMISWIKNRQTVHMFKALSIAAIAGSIGLLINAHNLLPVYDFGKESKRAGQLIMSHNNKKDVVIEGKTKGLSIDYAFQWSYGKIETFSLLFPGIKGYGLYMAQREGEQYLYPSLDENSNMAKYLTEKMNVPEDQAANFAMQSSRDLYWGDQPFTSGPVYLGAVICFLFIFGLFYLDGKHKWWILAVSIFAILLSWGNHLTGFNYFMFEHLPFYNKFRVPTMILVIPQLLFPVIAALTIDKLMDNTEDKKWRKFRWSIFTTASIFVLVALLYTLSDFSKENKDRTKVFNEIFNPSDPAIQIKLDSLTQLYPPSSDNQLYENMMFNTKGEKQVSKGVVGALRKDRALLLSNSMLRSFLFVFIAVVFIALYIKKKLKVAVMVAGVSLAAIIDLLTIDIKYLNEKSFDNKDKYEATEFPMSETDKLILKDNDPNFRVFNVAGGDPFQESKTSYYHKSVGGYHPAKLGIYDDIASYQLSGSPNSNVLNMLNVKYLIRRNPQGGQQVKTDNPGAMGNCWFVKGVRFVNGPVEEMKALDYFNPRDSAFVDEKFKNLVGQFSPADSSAHIKQTAFDNDTVRYESQAPAAQFAVFSEIYYKDWIAYIDEKPVPIIKANYVLRALVIPAGKHIIQFRFVPKMYFTGLAITKICSWLLLILLALYLFWLLRPLMKKRDNLQ